MDKRHDDAQRHQIRRLRPPTKWQQVRQRKRRRLDTLSALHLRDPAITAIQQRGIISHVHFTQSSVHPLRRNNHQLYR
jgi:hypothetical protein